MPRSVLTAAYFQRALEFAEVEGVTMTEDEHGAMQVSYDDSEEAIGNLVNGVALAYTKQFVASRNRDAED